MLRLKSVLLETFSWTNVTPNYTESQVRESGIFLDMDQYKF